MSHTLLTEVAALVLSAAAIAYVCFRIGLVPIVGFLVTGVVIGPNAVGLVREDPVPAALGIALGARPGAVLSEAVVEAIPH